MKTRLSEYDINKLRNAAKDLTDILYDVPEGNFDLSNESNEYDNFIPHIEIKNYFVNSKHEITYIIDSSDFIIPYKLPLLEEYLDKIIFDLTPYIKKTLHDYELIDGLGKLIGLCVSNEIVTNVVFKKNNKISCIPIIEEKYENILPQYKKYKIYSEYNLNDIDKDILLDLNIPNKEYFKILEDKKNQVDFYKKFYNFLKNNYYEDFLLIDSFSGALKLKNYNKYKFNYLIEENQQEYYGKFVKIFDYDEINYDIYGKITSIDIKHEDNNPDPDTIYVLTLEISYLEKVNTLSQQIKIIKDIRNDLYEYLYQYLNIDILNKFSDEQKNLYLNQFIDLVIINKNNLENLNDLLYSDILLKDLPNCSTENSLIFNSQQYYNGYLDNEFSKTSRFVQNYFNTNLDTKSLNKFITIIPNFINKKFPGCIIEVPFEENEIRNISKLLNINEKEIIKILIERYKDIFQKNNTKSLNKIKKFNSYEISNEEFLDSIKKPNYELTPIDFTFISEIMKITIYLYSAKFSKNNKYEELIFNENNENELLLYHYKETIDKKIVHKLGYITK